MKYGVRAFFYIIGLLMLTLGISLIIRANIGAAPWDALAVGESRLFHLSVGTCIFINGCVLIVINAILLRKKMELLAALSIFLIGMLVDFWLNEGLALFHPLLFSEKLTFLLIGVLLLGVGISIYLQAHLPSSPMDTLMVAIHKRFGLNIRDARFVNEAIAVTLAIIFQGAVGIGTVIVAFTLGFVIHYAYPIMEKLYTSLSSK